MTAPTIPGLPNVLRRDASPRPRMPRGDGETVELRDGALACRSCGVEVVAGAVETIPTLRRGMASPLTTDPENVPTWVEDVDMTRCPDCASRRRRAVALVTALRLGSLPGLGEAEVDRLDAALAALDVIGVRGDQTRGLTRTAADTRSFIGAFAMLGGYASWSRTGRRGRVAAAERWGCVPADVPGETAVAYREFVHRRAELPTACPPPAADGGARGCLMCGTGTLRCKPSDAAAAWGPLRRVSVGELGGRPQPQLAVGYLCPRCRAVVAEVGAVGLPAVERAILRHLGYSIRVGREFTQPLGRAWVALPDGTAPNAEPWAHIRPEVVARKLDSAIGVRKVPAASRR